MTGARWLGPAERQAWLALYAVATMLPGTLDADLNRRAKITLFDYHVLAMLSEAGDHTLPMSELAGRSNASLSRLSHVVTKLEGRGWVRRSQSTRDLRVTTATITGEGLENLQVLAVDHVDYVRQLVFDALDDRDVTDLERVGKKILARLDETHWILKQSAPVVSA
ncbi:DNA-binding MarR family transcriptional regulator [Arthrobacter pigmenti]|uniref:DNA-binding MarR family transcriptional regulator n=1 Tax=Arthrobacter pigmenti TaxID=271432 RepID=A0A846RWZ7_9MICC|nr:MarR family transcriptional regulator [Arthrobacter pigmenti]NJC23536.1 DNA-binding MarR family transcriptional regulator [Arthrobacter pigmenti]